MTTLIPQPEGMVDVDGTSSHTLFRAIEKRFRLGILAQNSAHNFSDFS